jgi:hypothetical protein
MVFAGMGSRAAHVRKSVNAEMWDFIYPPAEAEELSHGGFNRATKRGSFAPVKK